MGWSARSRSIHGGRNARCKKLSGLGPPALGDLPQAAARVQESVVEQAVVWMDHSESDTTGQLHLAATFAFQSKVHVQLCVSLVDGAIGRRDLVERRRMEGREIHERDRLASGRVSDDDALLELDGVFVRSLNADGGDLSDIDAGFLSPCHDDAQEAGFAERQDGHASSLDGVVLERGSLSCGSQMIRIGLRTELAERLDVDLRLDRRDGGCVGRSLAVLGVRSLLRLQTGTRFDK